MFCVNCGNELEEGAQSCPLCNKKIEDESITSQDVKDFAVEYSTLLKEKGAEFIDATQKKIEEKKMENARKQAEQAKIIESQQGQMPVMMNQQVVTQSQQGQIPVMMNQQGVMPPQQGRGRLRCPKCQNENLQVITETATKGSDFSLWKGCCGRILLGPFGLLCGMCGKGKQMKTTTYWICPMCGNKFKA